MSWKLKASLHHQTSCAWHAWTDILAFADTRPNLFVKQTFAQTLRNRNGPTILALAKSKREKKVGQNWRLLQRHKFGHSELLCELRYTEPNDFFRFVSGKHTKIKPPTRFWMTVDKIYQQNSILSIWHQVFLAIKRTYRRPSRYQNNILE